MRNYGDTSPAINRPDYNKVLVNKEDFLDQLAALLEALNGLYPVGSVKMWYDNDDHSNFLGFTWERCLEGRMPAGITAADSDFDTIGKTGGEKTHALTTDEAPPLHARGIAGVNGSNDRIERYDGASGQPHNNMPPYEVVSFWRRKA